MMYFSKVPQSCFKVIYPDQATIEISMLLAICIFKTSNPINKLSSQNSGIFISFVTSLSQNWGKKRTQVVYHVSRVMERS